MESQLQAQELEKSRVNATWNIRKVLMWSVGYLSDQDIQSARIDVEHLLSHVLRCDRVQLYMQFDKPLTLAEREQFKGLLGRRAKKEPVAYLTGEKDFFGRSFSVNSNVLIPRSDTESVIDHCKERFPDQTSSMRILDVGAGSGCIGLTLACEYPNAQVVLCDISSAALDCAMKNAERLNVLDRVAFMVADAHGLQAHGEGFSEFDMVVSNPPYISSSDISSLMEDVGSFEPRIALDGGDDGLDFYRSITQQSICLLKPKGRVVFEVGIGQSDDVSDILHEAGFCDISVRKDLGGVRRAVSGCLLDKEV